MGATLSLFVDRKGKGGRQCQAYHHHQYHNDQDDQDHDDQDDHYNGGDDVEAPD